MLRKIQTPLTKETLQTLHAGDQVLLSGVIYTARDAAHKRLCELIGKGKASPIPLQDSVIYFVGPTPEKPGQVMGSAGPTTSYRMDAYSPSLIALGLTGMIGKGKRGEEVIEAMRQYGAVYFGAVGGCGALLGKCVKHSQLIAYPELGAEAIRRLEVEDLPLTVVIDSWGNDLYKIGPMQYLQAKEQTK